MAWRCLARAGSCLSGDSRRKRPAWEDLRCDKEAPPDRRREPTAEARSPRAPAPNAPARAADGRAGAPPAAPAVGRAPRFVHQRVPQQQVHHAQALAGGVRRAGVALELGEPKPDVVRRTP